MGRCFLYRSNASAVEKGEIIVTAEVGATVTCSNGEVTKTETATNGTCIFPKLSEGTWTIKTTQNGETITETVVMDYPRRIFVVLANNIPAFTYTGDFAIVDDDDNPITQSRNNWKVRFLSSGVLTFSNLKGAINGIDVFLVGGGGGGGYGKSFASGGGGGYTKTEKGVAVAVNTPYEIVVGEGGTPVNSGSETYGGESSAFGFSADGGQSGEAYASYNANGGAGGSGGGAGMIGGDDHVSGDGHGGEDGADGGSVKHGSTTGRGGNGQGTTTREFGEPTGKLCAGGGGGGASRGLVAYPPARAAKAAAVMVVNPKRKLSPAHPTQAVAAAVQLIVLAFPVVLAS